MTIAAVDLDHILKEAAPAWGALRDKRIFITGGTGFFGAWLLESIAHANRKLGLGLHAVVLTRDLTLARKRLPHLLLANPHIEFHEGDIKTFTFPRGDFSYVIHAATPASAHLNTEEPLQMFDTIVYGTRRVLEFARSAGVKGFLFTSSGAVYGRQPSAMTHVPEEYEGAADPMDHHSAYSSGKRAAEHLCALYHRQFGIETKIARCFAFVGPYLPLDVHFAIGNFIYDSLRRRPIQVGGDGTPYRSYLYAADLMIWLWTILERGAVCRPYNVGSEEDLTIAELAGKVGSQGGLEVRIAKKAIPDRPPERYVPLTKRAQSELGLKQLVSLEDSIGRTLLWHQNRERT